MSLPPALLRVALLLSVLLPRARAHAAMVAPRQRGALLESAHVPTTIDYSAPRDYYTHFPAGVKSDAPGAGKLSQQQAAGARGWYPYDPYDAAFVWRAGVCGDTVSGAQQHLRGGAFYHDAKLVARYRQGGTIGIGMSVIAHHNGFIEAHLCDVAKCAGGDISRDCFASGACIQLHRARNAECDSGASPHCGPIDRNYPGRWYLPCARAEAAAAAGGHEYFAPEYATFQLPRAFFCEHCVLQWYWATANDCNPPGVLDYFDGPDRPAWGACRGQGDARGGVTRNKRPCGGAQHFAEEYYQCADVQIVPLGGGRSAGGAAAAAAVAGDELALQAGAAGAAGEGRNYPRMRQFGDGVFRSLLLWADGIPSRELRDGAVVDISVYKRVGVEAVLADGAGGEAGGVQFYVDGEVVDTAAAAPFFMFARGDEVPAYWDAVPVNRPVALGAAAGDDMVQVSVTFVR